MVDLDNKRVVPPSDGESNPVFESEFKPQVTIPQEENVQNNEEPTRCDVEILIDDEMKIFKEAFKDKAVQRCFLRKLFALLLLMLTVNLIFICFSMYHPDVSLFLEKHLHLLYFAIGTMVAFMIIICCSEERKKFPLNYIFLTIFTLSITYVWGALAHNLGYVAFPVLIAMTAWVCIGVILFTLQTKFDYSMLSGMIVTFLMLSIFIGIGSLFVLILPEYILQLMFAAFTALVFSLYIVYDTRFMVQGRHRHGILPDEYVYAALVVYLVLYRY